MLNPPRERPSAWLPSFLGAGSVLEGEYGGAVDEQDLQVRIVADHSDHTRPYPLFAPAREPGIRGMPVAQRRVQIAPRRAGACYPQHRFDKQTVVLGGYATVAGFARQNVFDSIPLVVSR